LLSTLPERGWRLRPRALTTTLFARLALADLFVHGLGGAKYDEMTDALFARCYRLPAPTLAVVTATLHLPLATPWPITPQILGQQRHRLWDLAHNPQRYASAELQQQHESLLQERQELVDALAATHQQHGRGLKGRRRRDYVRLRAVVAELGELLAPLRRRWQQEYEQSLQQHAANRWLSSREWSWLLFPAELLQTFYQQQFGGAAPSRG
jgi:hypothetical protein